jgi:hypothetical protein
MAEGDKDRPQVTQSSDSAEPSSISPLDTRSVSPPATGKGPLGLSDLLRDRRNPLLAAEYRARQHRPR